MERESIMIDQARWDVGRWDCFYWDLVGFTTPDPALADTARADYSRFGVYKDYFNKIVEKFHMQGQSLFVTRRKLVLGAPDSVTGWYAKEFTESTIEMIIIPRKIVTKDTMGGTFTRTDMLGYCLDGVLEGDEIKTEDGKYFEVKGVEDLYCGDGFMYRIVDLTELPFHEEVL